MAFSTSSILTPQPTRQDFANAFGNNQRLIRFFEQLTNDVRQTLPDAIVSVQDVSAAPFVVQAASTLVPNAFVLQHGEGLTLTTAPGALTLALTVPVVIADGGTGATDAAHALANLGGVTAAQAAAAAPVQTVFGRTGNVIATTGDYTATQVTGAAHSGANSDITSLSGLTTALSVGQGGTGATTAATARTALGAAASGANSDITSLTAPPIITGTAGVAAPTGFIGELLLAQASGVALANGTPKDIATLPLTAGNWLVWGQIQFSPAATTTQTLLEAGIGQTANTLPAAPFVALFQGAVSAGLSNTLVAPQIAVVTATATTVRIVGAAIFAGSTETASAYIYAMRFH